MEHLRTANHRCEQIGILSVLLLYMKNVSIRRFKVLKEHDNMYIVEKMAELIKNPSVMVSSDLLYF